MNRVRLTIATTDYDHFRDFRFGLVEAEGVEHTWLTLGHHEIFSRFTFNREWDVSELSFAKFMAEVTRPEPDIIALPVFASRLFRFGAFYVNRNSGIKTAGDLKGKRVGSPEWAHTAAVWMRGWLAHEAGVPLNEVDLPDGVRLTRIADKSLSDMLAAGEIDCAIIARPPTCFLRGHRDVVRLHPDFVAMEQDSFERTGVFPIMHVIAIKRRIVDAHPWIARNLYNAFEESKRRSLQRLLDPAVSRYPLPWLADHARQMRDMFGGDPFPFGIDENRATLDTFLQYTHEQGIARRRLAPEDIFPKGIMAPVKV
jgi:4,5-dihydroxyphthalate decarboxylase